mmetsp:Transcript_19666/g.30387  ORF Transcript_19666/g.30387 Transcript_19666/m.30387 type:complete len:94 (+) Transcript_19666:3096-3377(+)
MGTIQSTLGIPSTGTTVTTEDDGNVLNKIMTGQSLYITTGNFAFVFPEFEILYGGNTITKCLPQTYELLAFKRYEQTELPLTSSAVVDESVSG